MREGQELTVWRGDVPVGSLREVMGGGTSFDIQVGRSLVLDTVADLATRLPSAAADVAEEQVSAVGGCKTLTAIVDLVEDRCRAALMHLRAPESSR